MNTVIQVLRRPIYMVKHLHKEKESKIATINPDTTEAVMKNIRGIPFLIQVCSLLAKSNIIPMFQAIQYSMETTYYRDVMTEMGEGVVRTSVIHTAPACTSVLDSDDEEHHTPPKITPRLGQFFWVCF